MSTPIGHMVSRMKPRKIDEKFHEIVWFQHFHEIQMLAGVARSLEKGLGVHTYLMGKKELVTESIQNSSK